MKIFTKALSFALLLSGAARAGGLPVSLNDWGGVGLVSSPSARLAPIGTFAAGLTVVRGVDRRVAVSLTPTSRLELAIHDAFPSRALIAEPGVDLKYSLMSEGERRPAIAIGGRDVTGSSLGVPGEGRYAGEYLVATRRWWDLDLTLGLGWGRMGEGGELPNPLAVLGGRYARRRPVGDPSRRGPGAWFTGDRIGILGGVEWTTPVEGLSLKADWGGERFLAEKLERPDFHAGNPLSLALAWRVAPEIELSAGWENGRRLMWRVSALTAPDVGRGGARPPRASANVNGLSAWLSAPGRWLRRMSGDEPEEGDEAETRSTVAPGFPSARRPAPGEPGASPEDLAEITRNLGVRVRAVRSTDEAATIWIDAPDHGPVALDVGRAARVLAGLAESGVERITVIVGRNGAAETAVEMSRDELLRVLARRGSAEEVWSSARLIAPRTMPPPPEWTVGTALTVGPVVEESLFEHTTAVVQRSRFEAAVRVEPFRGWSFEAAGGMRTSDGTAALDTQAFPVPHPVRSDVAAFSKPRAVPLRLTAAWTATPGPGWRARLTAGALDEMFTGLSAEILHHDPDARWAAGAVVDWVRKRRPGPTLAMGSDAFADARALVRLDAPGRSDTWVGIEAGRYLAGDLGATVEFAGELSDRLSLGGHLTWTDGSARGPYGVGGRFDIGLSLAIRYRPVRAVPIEGRGETRIVTLGRDAGQRVRPSRTLWEDERAAGRGRILGGWSRSME